MLIPRLLTILCVGLLASPAFGDDDEFNTQLMRATVKISHDRSTATGFILTSDDGKRQFLVTAAHVLDMSPDDETTVVFRSRREDGVYQKEPLKLAIRQQGKPIWARHPSEDAAAIGITPPATADVPRIPVSLLATDDSLKKTGIHPGTQLSSLGYPHRNEANEAGFPILRTGAIGSFPLVPMSRNKSFLYSSNTFEGDSGGPVFFAQSAAESGRDIRLILGLITGQMFLDEEAKMIYGTTKIRHRMGLAIVLQAGLIKETIDRLP